jgi:hypothetical protein
MFAHRNFESDDHRHDVTDRPVPGQIGHMRESLSPRTGIRPYEDDGEIA